MTKTAAFVSSVMEQLISIPCDENRDQAVGTNSEGARNFRELRDQKRRNGVP